MLKRIDHIGVVVDDLERVSRFMTDVLGMAFVRGGGDPGRGVRTAFFACGEGQIELIEVSDPEIRSRRLGEESARIEHIAVEVDDLMETITELSGKGVRATAPGPVRTTSGLVLFSEPESTGGVAFQFLQRER